MTWGNRFKLVFGVLMVIVFTFALTLVFNHRQNQVSSVKAQVAADVYDIGADHPGTVVEQRVKEGDSITKGQVLFVVQSLQLKEDLANGLVVQDTPAYRVDEARGMLTYLAVSDGTVHELEARQGNSVPANTPLATIYGGERFINATFRVAPRDYSRLVPGAQARVVLPNDQVISADLDKIAVTSDADGAVVTAKLTSSQLAGLQQQTLAEPGTPVLVTVELTDLGPLAPVTDVVNDFLQKVGLR